jgi:hypothetical protein
MKDLELFTIAGLLGTERAKEWIDEYTTVGVVLGDAGAFVAAGAPMVVWGTIRKLG